MSSILIINKIDELNKVINENKYVFVDFYANWCGPCKAIAPIIQDLAKEENDVIFVKVDVDTAKELSEKFKISSIPTLIYFKDGKEFNKTFGFTPKHTIVNNLNNLKS